MADAFSLPSDGKTPSTLGEGARITFEEPCYALMPGEQGDFDSSVLRVVYSSLTTPRTVIDQDLVTGQR